ncbi:MAG: hypothetical protein M3Q30_12970 [Actinomycetota bacterium]|nr:hypothetical protein [Actinomycetota bacterium]
MSGPRHAAARRCVAVGYSNNNQYGYSIQTLVEQWDGKNWSVTASANLPGTINLLSGVSCTSAAACVAVGTHYQNISQTLVERWDGTNWSAVPSPSQVPLGNYLNGVSCVSASSCVAVGSYCNGSRDQTLVISDT